MKKTLFCIVCLVAMMAASTSLKAQEITITLSQGWNWISYPNAVSMEIGEALGSFVPMEGDMVKSQSAFSSYHDGIWTGALTHFMPGKGYVYYSSRSETTSFVFAQATSSVVATATPTDITSVSALVGGMVMLPEGSHVFLRGVCWGTEPNPTIEGSHTTDSTGTGSYVSMLTDLNPNTTYYVRAYATNSIVTVYGERRRFTTESENRAYVDLGLPSGTLWATCNVGADNPEDYGGYFDGFCYYIGECDVATSHWGRYWRTPTEAEFEELIGNTTNTWTTQNGVNGRLFTASNGNSIFLPAAFDSYGSYWSSSGYDYTIVGNLSFDSDDCFVGGDDCEYELSVRPVRSGFQNPSNFIYIIEATANPVEGTGIVIGGGIYEQGQVCTLAAIANTGYTFSNWTEGGNVVSTNPTYTFTVNADRTLVANFTPSGNGGPYVDLGLPSGRLWAIRNVGAFAPWDYGNHFAWGETQEKDFYMDFYDWWWYQYSNGNQLTKYCNNSSYGYNGFTDTLTILLPEDDAATANWGEGWCMPTLSDWQELYNNTTQIWTTQNGVDGRLFTASNGNSLFLPAAGQLFYDGDFDRNDIIGEGSFGCYWSSSLNTDDPYGAWQLGFDTDYPDYCNMSSGSRCYGQSVRPVSGFRINAMGSPAVGGEVIGGGTYNQGSTCNLTATPSEGWHFVDWTENGKVVSTAATYSFVVTGNRTLVANFAEGKLNGVFSVGENSQIYFSQGNLQYQASIGIWRFAENQWDYVGADNANISETNSGWIDLFGWGTSGYNHGAVCYQPWSTSQTNSDYYAYGDYQYNLYDQTGQADWGYNPISNGSNQENHWRTLTQPEWNYVFNTRTTLSGIRYAKANVNDVNGVILLPDDWDSGTYSLNSTNSGGASFSSNTLTASQWSTLEQAGAVFLPAAGYRSEASVYSVGSYGSYWSASFSGSSYARAVRIGGSYLGTGSNFDRYDGRSVRLVAPSANSFGVNVASSPEAGGEVIGGGIYHAGAECTLTAMPSEGWSFVNWTEDGVVVSTNATYIFSVMGDRTLVANYRNNITASASPTMGGTVSGGGTYDYGQDCTLTATADENFTFVNWTEGSTVVSTNAIYTFTVTGGRTLVANFSYSGGAYAYVDLGLPSGLLWATCNVGADAPWDYGDYFAWGETQPKDDYNWDTYQYSNGGFYEECKDDFIPYLTKYCNRSSLGYNGFTDNLTTLLPEDDAATANWGSGWRMPTKEEWQELYNNTTVTWTTQNGVNGRLFTAANGNSLFLPAAGFHEDSDLYGGIGFYWSSSLYTGGPLSAWCFSFSSDWCYVRSDFRSDGLSVRAVRSSQN